MGRFKVNADLAPVKSHYLFFNGGMSPVVPFLPVVGRQLGISSSMVGWIYFALPFVGLLSRSGFGYLADRLHVRKRMLFFAVLAVAASFFAVQFSPSLEAEQPVDLALNCDPGSSPTLVSTGRFSCPCTWRALNYVDHDSNASCALTCGAETRPVVLMNMGIEVNSTQGYNNDCPTDALLETVTIPVSLVGNDCPAVDKCHVKCGGDFVLRECLASGPESYLQSPGYWFFFTSMIFVWSSMAVSSSLSDTLCFMVLGAKASDYGKQRLWGSVGWGSVVLLAGFLVDEKNPSKNPIKDYSICYWLAMGFLLADALNVLFIRVPRMRRKSQEVKESKEDEEQHLSSDQARKLELSSFLHVPIVIFILIVVLEGMCMAMIWSFFYWYLDDLSGVYGVSNPKLLQGLVSFIQCFAGELPFFFLSGRVIKKLGHQGALTLVMIAFGGRFLLYSLLTNPWISLAIEVTQGLTFSIFYATMTSYVHKIYPHEVAATMQGFIGGMNEIGVAIGSLVGGYVIAASSTRILFRSFGVGALTVGVLHLLLRLSVKSIDRFQGFAVPDKPSISEPDHDGEHEHGNGA